MVHMHKMGVQEVTNHESEASLQLLKLGPIFLMEKKLVIGWGGNVSIFSYLLKNIRNLKSE